MAPTTITLMHINIYIRINGGMNAKQNNIRFFKLFSLVVRIFGFSQMSNVAELCSCLFVEMHLKGGFTLYS